jgi:hypothetical protein
MPVIGVNQRATPVQQPREKDRTFTEKSLDNVFKAMQIASIGYGMKAKYDEIQIANQIANRNAESAEESSMQEREAKFAEKFRKDDMAKSIEESYNQANTITELAKRKNISQPEFATMMFKTVRAAAGGGQISDKDIELFAPDPGRLKVELRKLI